MVCGRIGGFAYVVGFPGEGDDVQEREEEHFYAEEHGGDAEEEVGEGDFGRRFEDAAGAGVGGREEGY